MLKGSLKRVEMRSPYVYILFLIILVYFFLILFSKHVIMVLNVLGNFIVFLGGNSRAALRHLGPAHLGRPGPGPESPVGLGHH